MKMMEKSDLCFWRTRSGVEVDFVVYGARFQTELVALFSAEFPPSVLDTDFGRNQVMSLITGARLFML